LKEEIKDNESKVKLVQKLISDRQKSYQKTQQQFLKKNKKKNLDLSDVNMIDEIIFNESRERVKDIVVINQCMKEAAIDCKILEKFHNDSGKSSDNGFKCADFSKANDRRKAEMQQKNEASTKREINIPKLPGAEWVKNILNKSNKK
jgi:hypothetical protein